MRAIWSVCNDPGGTNGVLPVAKKLYEMGHKSIIIPNGKALELLPNMGIEFLTLDKALEVAPEPDAVVTSMCSEGGIGLNLVPLMRLAGIPTVALQDYWGARLWTSWADPTFRPTYICVNDEIGAEIVLRAWPNFDRNNIVITGFPAMDKYASLDIKSTTTRVKSTLNLTLDKPIVFYASQIERENEIISEVVAALNEIKADIYFVPRSHPRMKNNAPAEVPKWEQALANFTGGTLIDSSACDTSSVIAAADIVISTYSTVNIEAACLRKANISVLYPEVGMQLFKAELPYLDDFPLVQLGCSAKATDRQELVRLIKMALVNKLGLREAQEKNFPLDGKNAQRAAELVSSLI